MKAEIRENALYLDARPILEGMSGNARIVSMISPGTGRSSPPGTPPASIMSHTVERKGRGF
jgi:hypothetical protein